MPRIQLIGVALMLAGLTACGTVTAPWRIAERARGRALFTERGCHACHSIGLLGTPTGPDLSHVGERWSRSDIESWLDDPSAHDPVAHMPDVDLTDDEISALATFLLSLAEEDASRAGRLTAP